MQSTASKNMGRTNNIVMSKGGAETRLDEFREMIAEYSAVAKRLFEHRKKLAAMIKEERDVNKIRELELRKSTVEAERYEVLDDMRELISYVGEREKCHGKK